MARRLGILIKTRVLGVWFLAAFAAAGSIALRVCAYPEKLREVVTAHLEKRLDREVRLGGVSLGLVRGLVVQGLEISEEDGFSEGVFAAAGTAPCGSGEVCVVVPSGGGNTCETEGATAWGASCTSTRSCVAGAGCYTVDSGVTDLCYKYCDLDDDNPGCADSGIPGAACASGLGSDPIGVCIAS